MLANPKPHIHSFLAMFDDCRACLWISRVFFNWHPLLLEWGTSQNLAMDSLLVKSALLAWNFYTEHFVQASPILYDGGHLASTYSALSILRILGDDLSCVEHAAVLQTVRELQQPDGRSVQYHHNECVLFSTIKLTMVAVQFLSSAVGS